MSEIKTQILSYSHMATQKQLIQKGINIYKKSLMKTFKYIIKQQFNYIRDTKKYLKGLEMDLKMVKSRTSIKKKKALIKHGYTINDNQEVVIEHIKADINYEKKQIKKYIKIKKEKKEDLDHFNSAIEKDIEKLKGKEHLLIIGVEYNPHVFSFYTTPLKIKYEDETYNIGHFQIDIRMNSSFPINITNLRFTMTIDDESSTYDHWCVKRTNPCFGTWATGIYKYLKQGQLYLAVDSIIRFLTEPKYHSGYWSTSTWLRNI